MACHGQVCGERLWALPGQIHGIAAIAATKDNDRPGLVGLGGERPTNCEGTPIRQFLGMKSFNIGFPWSHFAFVRSFMFGRSFVMKGTVWRISQSL
jgi:hypothetical protein